MCLEADIQEIHLTDSYGSIFAARLVITDVCFIFPQSKIGAMFTSIQWQVYEFAQIKVASIRV